MSSEDKGSTQHHPFGLIESDVELMAMHSQADLVGLSQAVIATITQARAPSTRQDYVPKWSLFADWGASC